MNIKERRVNHLCGRGLCNRAYCPLLFGGLIVATIWCSLGIQQVFGEASHASEYESTWESLDSRATPDWFQDAKFGIFIHWGLYSVPAWSPRGTYAEWYWHAKDGLPRKHAAAVARSEAVKEFHNRVYGENFQYKDFRPLFTCELFDPEQWAKIFKRSGARYVVLTSKHHDGYCLWPSKEATESFGTEWNSVESGPQRDLVGDLTQAVRAEGLKMRCDSTTGSTPRRPKIDQNGYIALDYRLVKITFVHINVASHLPQCPF